MDRVLHLTEEPEGLLPGMVLSITDDTRVYYRRLASVSGKRLVLKTDVGRLRLDKAWVGEPVHLAVEYLKEVAGENGTKVFYLFRAAGDWSYLDGQPVTRITRPEEEPPVYPVNNARYIPVADGTRP